MHQLNGQCFFITTGNQAFEKLLIQLIKSIMLRAYLSDYAIKKTIYIMLGI